MLGSGVQKNVAAESAGGATDIRLGREPRNWRSPYESALEGATERTE
jgi:hypothetical protein